MAGLRDASKIVKGGMALFLWVSWGIWVSFVRPGVVVWGGAWVVADALGDSQCSSVLG